MRITLIAALAQNRVIGCRGQLPWHLPADLRRFKRQTLNKPILMGRLTYESIGRPLPKRRNIVMTRQRDFSSPGVEVFHDFDTVLSALSMDPELMVIGGGQIYQRCLSDCHRMLLTIVMSEPHGDTFFPEFSPSDWSMYSREDHVPDDDNRWGYSFIELRRDGSGQQLPDDFPRRLPGAV